MRAALQAQLSGLIQGLEFRVRDKRPESVLGTERERTSRYRGQPCTVNPDLNKNQICERKFEVSIRGLGYVRLQLITSALVVSLPIKADRPEASKHRRQDSSTRANSRAPKPASP